MPFKVHAKTSDRALAEHRRELAFRVVSAIGADLASASVLCFLDDEDWDSYRAGKGVPWMRGFFGPVEAEPALRKSAPPYLKEVLFLNDAPVFEFLIYLFGSTCSSDVGLTMTLAHELQHLMQFRETPDLFWANYLMNGLTASEVAAIGISQSFELPHEREARVVASRTAGHLRGSTEVERYIQDRVSSSPYPDDKSDWEFVRHLDLTEPFDLRGETRALYKRLRPHGPMLHAVRRRFTPQLPPDDLDKLFDGA